MTREDYPQLLEQVEGFADAYNLKDYHAFVYWFMDTYFGYDKNQILDSICDGTHDKGVDAVVIDRDAGEVIVIQSKFEKRGNRARVKESDIKLLASVKNYFSSRRALEPITARANRAARRLLIQAFDTMHRHHFSLRLFFITTHRELPGMAELVEQTLNFKPGEFMIFLYDTIIQLFRDKMRDWTPPVGSYSLKYSPHDGQMVRTSGQTSWVLSVPLEEIRTMSSEFGDRLFKKNVRNFLGQNRCNKGIQQTLKDCPQNFWYYNNGITILCDQARLNVENQYIRLENPQIVNGCQTARSIERFQGSMKGEVLVRVMESRDHDFIGGITLYQNTSNAVKKRDLKSNDPIQIRLENDFKRLGIYYETKRGQEFRVVTHEHPALKAIYKDKVNNEMVAKVLAAVKVSPAVALARGSEYFFDELYDRLFTVRTSVCECLALTQLYLMIKSSYGGERFHDFDKAFKFKNRAVFHVLRFLYDSIGRSKTWEKHFVSLVYGPNRARLGKFRKSLSKPVDDYFEIIHRTWHAKQKKQELRLDTYLQKSTTFNEIARMNARSTKSLRQRVRSIFDTLPME